MKLILSTCSEKEADSLAEKLLQERLVACVNILSGLISKYWWKGNLESDKEYLLIMKTKPELVEQLVKRIKELHSYEVPEIIVLNIEGGNTEYLKWIKEVTG